MKWLKVGIKTWVASERKKENETIDLKAQLNILDSLADNGLLTDLQAQSRAKILSEWKISQRKNKEDLLQKSRMKWTLGGDENSRFFHAMVNSNISSNRIHGMMIQGQWSTDPSAIKHFVAEFFRKKFDNQVDSKPPFTIPGIKKLTTDQAKELIVPFSMDEIKMAVWDCEGNKAPGPDGFNFCFIKRYWDLLKMDYYHLMVHFYHNSSISWGCMAVFIALIPKKCDPQNPDDSRPVSLIGVINKAISKVMQNRLKKVIGYLIMDEQSAYVANRSI